MVLVITELKTGEPLAILDWITKEKLEAWIWNIPLKYHKKIKWFSTDCISKNYVLDFVWKNYKFRAFLVHIFHII